MPLSRLENFLKNAEGNILYVNPSDFDATDSYENRGNSLTRPFRSIQRALIEAARFSYQAGRNNDKIDTTTILVYPGTHYIDNRPGYSITNQSGSAEIKRYFNSAWTTSGATLNEFSENSNFDIFDPDNDLYRYNSVEGGTILPRGTSIVGLDLRKTKIRPLYVPDPLNDSVDSSAIFRVTGTCYFTAFTIFDADLRRPAYKDSTTRKVTPNFSHHKLTCFEYADGVNKVRLGSELTDLTDLDMYYNKVTYAYGETSGRGLSDYPNPSGNNDFEPSVDEFRIVGDLRADSIGITSIRSGDGVVPTTTITVTTQKSHGLYKDTPVLITGITTNTSSYTGSLIVSDVLNETQFQYISAETPTNALPNFTEIINGSVIVESDSVSSASPYIFSCTLRSVYGLNGMLGDGSKATGFKSMLTAQFTGISLQKDDNAFILYDQSSGVYNDTLTVDETEKPLHINSRSIYKPGWESSHMRVTNNALFQCVSIFAIGYARHFVAESGGDMSITNSNSNFGALSLESIGFRGESFDRDDVGYITHVIPPRESQLRTTNVSWVSIDVPITISIGKTERLYLSGYTNSDIPPSTIIDGYRIGAKRGELLNLPIIINNNETIFQAPILMDIPSNTGVSTSAEKIYYVGRSAGINSITSNILTLTSNHQLFNGEKIRVYSDNGALPSNVTNNQIYYAITDGLTQNQLKLSVSVNDAAVGNNVNGISNGGGVIKILSAVSDKDPGDFGHPVQFDSAINHWYLNVSKVTLYNTIYDKIVELGVASLGQQTPATYVTRRGDTRSLDEKLYKVRYVIPKEFIVARPPTDGFTLQESKSVGIGSVSFVNSSVGDPTQLRNPRIITNASYDVGTQSVTIKTELPHNLIVGDRIKISNVVSTSNLDTTLTDFNNLPYNGIYEISSVLTPRSFKYTGISSNPGTFLNQVNQRSTQQQIGNLPTVQREKYKDNTFIYRSDELKQLIPGADGQDGVYTLTLISGSISPNPTIGFGISDRRFNQDVKNLYPQLDRDNFNSDPIPTTSYAELYPVGSVLTNDKKNSLTKEALNIFLQSNQIGYAITGAVITGTGNTTITLFTNVPHNLNSIKSLSLTSPGSGYNNSAGITSTIYSADLINYSILGNYASVKAVVSAANTVSSVTIVDPGSAYNVNEVLTISSDPAAVPTSYATVTVTQINNNVGDTLELTGFNDPKYDGFYKIIGVPDTKSISIYNPNGASASYVARNDSRFPQAYLASSGIPLSSLSFTGQTGIGTVVSSSVHGLLPGNSFKLVGIANTYFRDKFFVSEVVGLTSFTFQTGITTVTQNTSVTGTTLHKSGFSANGRFFGIGEENLGGRGSYIYAGITTTLSGNVTSADGSITLASSNGFYKGDYVLIGTEIMRISTNPINNTFSVTRGQFTTVSSTHDTGESVKKIRVLPIELRRHSILRASGHTFEYLGYGPGNYSTGLPIKQNRILSDSEVLVSQAREQDGGTVVYTGMNDRGEFYNGATKINGATGEETVIEAPISTIFGEDLAANLAKKNSGVFDDLLVKERLTVEGGENSNQTSQFYGPVNFSGRVTSTSEDGLEAKELFLRGNAAQPKQITIGISTPTEAKKSGDISLLSTPGPGEYLGHIYSDGDWRRFGMISREKDRDFLTLDQVGIGESTSIFNFRDALEVNGTLKVKNLYVGGAVTFAGAQAIGSAEFDVLKINKTVTYVGQSTNYTIYSQNPNSIAQFQNLEVIGSAVTFTTPKVQVQNEFVSTYLGVSTFLGSVQVDDLIVVQDYFSVNRLNVNYSQINILGVVTEAYIPSGIITAIRSKYIGGFGNAGTGQTAFSIYANSGFVTSITGTAATIGVFNATNAYITKARVEELIAPSLLSPVGLVTTLSGSNLTYTRSNIGLGTFANLFAGAVYTPSAYVNYGLTTTLYSNYINVSNLAIGNSFTAPGVNVDTGVFGNAQVTSKLWLSGTGTDEGLYANIGIITQFGNGTRNQWIHAGPSGIVTANYYRSTVSGTTSSGLPPFVVASSNKVTNLNADLLDNLDTSVSNTPNTVVIRDSSGNFQAGIVTATKFIGTFEGSITPPSNGYLGVGNAYVSSGGDAAVLSTYVYTTNGGTSYTAATQTAGGVYKISGQTHTWYKHNGSVTPVLTQLLALDVSGNLTAVGYVEASSDARLKTNVVTIENALDKVCQLRGVEYDRVDIEAHQIGVIAQELEEVFPELVSTNEDGMKSVAYGNLVGALIESIKELKGEITELRQELDILKGNK